MPARGDVPVAPGKPGGERWQTGRCESRGIHERRGSRGKEWRRNRWIPAGMEKNGAPGQPIG